EPGGRALDRSAGGGAIGGRRCGGGGAIGAGGRRVPGGAGSAITGRWRGLRHFTDHAALEQAAPPFTDRFGVLQELLVHRLRETGVRGLENVRIHGLLLPDEGRLDGLSGGKDNAPLGGLQSGAAWPRARLPNHGKRGPDQTVRGSEDRKSTRLN